MDFEEERNRDRVLEGSNSGVKPFQMTDLYDPLGSFRYFGDTPGGFEIACNRLLDEHVDAPLEQLTGYGGVFDSRNRNDRRVGVLRKLNRTMERRTPILCRRVRRAGWMRVDDGRDYNIRKMVKYS